MTSHLKNDSKSMKRCHFLLAGDDPTIVIVYPRRNDPSARFIPDGIKEWGRIGSGGHVRHDRFSSEGQALNALIKASEAKARRGYFRKS